MIASKVFSHSRNKSRRASILVCVLACMAIAMGLVTSTVRRALDARRDMRTQHQVQQTELLLAAGVQRATKQIRASTDYEGETWTLAESVLPLVDAAEVAISISAENEASKREVRVIARLSTGPATAVQRSYTFSIDLPQGVFP